MTEKNSDNGYYPKAGDELRFYLKHLIKLVKKEKPVEDDKLFKATNVKTYDRKKDRHGYNPGEDQKVYESKKLNDILKVDSLGEALSYDFKKLKNPDPGGRTSDKSHADLHKSKAESPKIPDRKPPKVYSKKLDESRGSTVDNHAAVELKLHADNSSHLFHGHRQMVHNNQMRHAKAGRYNRELAVKAWEHHARVAADDYASTYGGLGERGHNIFNKATRKAVAKQLEKEHYEDHIGPYLANQRGFNK